MLWNICEVFLVITAINVIPSAAFAFFLKLIINANFNVIYIKGLIRKTVTMPKKG